MKSKLENLPCYSRYHSKMEASIFNPIRLAQIRKGAGDQHALRIQIKQLRHLDLLVDDETWICVDRDQNDIPIIAWLNFKVHDRQDLFNAIDCDVYSYHAHADKIEQRVLEYAVQHLIRQQAVTH